MPYEHLRTGQKVSVGNKTGKIIENADKYKVKFEDGSFGFFDGNEIKPLVIDTCIKSTLLKNETVYMSAESQKEDPYN